MRISVTQSHINRGVQSSIAACPIALALSDAGNGIGYWGTTKGHLIPLPSYDTFTQNKYNLSGNGVFYKAIEADERRVEAFVVSFDRDGSEAVRPFDFEVEPLVATEVRR